MNKRKPIKSDRVQFKGTYAIFKESFTLVNLAFKNRDKSLLWFYLPNPNLGGCIPMEMIFMSRGHKLIKFIKSCLYDQKIIDKVE